jgi:hypothetical protein
VSLVIRPIEGQDEARWREMWDGYSAFYEREPDPDPPVADPAWARLMAPSAPPNWT